MTTKKTTKSLKSTYHRVYLFLLILSVLLTSLFTYWQKDILKPYKISLVKHRSFSKNVIIQDYYHDFDHDGFSEKIRFKYQINENQIGVIYYFKDDKLYDQWNFSEKWIPKAVYFADYDGDLFDEIYFFTLSNDSLFLYSFDPRNRNQFLLYRQFLIKAPAHNPHPKRIWDLATPEAVFFDADDDGFKECFINLSAGLSLKPRRLIRFDLNQKKITASTPDFGAYVLGPIVVDVDGDGTPEILMKNSYAPDNYHKPIPFKDDNAYLMIFDKNLNFFFKPKIFHKFRSSVINIPYTINNRVFLFSSYSYAGHLNINSKIFLYNFKGRELREKMFPKGEVLLPFIVMRNNHEQLFLISQTSGEILRPNFNLDIVKRIKTEYPLNAMLAQEDLNGDLQKEFIAISQKGYYTIVAPDFKYSYRMPLKVSSEDILNFKLIGNKGSEIVIQKDNGFYHFQYRTNGLYTWRYLIFILMIFSFYAIFSGLFLLWQRFSAIHHVQENLFQFTPTGLCVVNHQSKINYLNGNFEHHLHLSKHIKSKKNVFESLEERPDVVQFIKKLIANRTFQEKEIVLRTKQGTIPLLLRGSVLSGIFKIPAGFLIETIPQETKVSNQKLEIWTKTVQKMAHDIKTPLATVQLILQSIKMRLGQSYRAKDEKINKDIETMDQELNRIREMTKQFLRFTNLEKPNFQIVSLKEIFKRVFRKFAYYKEDGLKVKYDLDELYDRLYADPILLEMCFQIIVENAIDAMKGKGVIMVSTSLVDQIDENFKRYLEIEIIDNGPGISPEIIDKIFDPFFTTKENGTGMGLTLAQKIIEDHEGRIEISSREGKSTQVRILIPYKEIDEK